MVAIDANFEPYIRSAKEEDITDILELWGNGANLRQLTDYINWEWCHQPSLVWQEFAIDMIQQPNLFLTIADFHDNGLTGFLLAEIRTLPPYYKAQYLMSINEFYLRPKERSALLFKNMLMHTCNTARANLNISDKEIINIQIEIINFDESLLDKSIFPNLIKSSTKYSLRF